MFELLVSAAAAATAFALWRALRLVLQPYRSPLRHLRGPRGTSWILGNFGDLIKDALDGGVLFETWLKEHGESLRWKGLFNNNNLLTTDPRAIHHILHTDTYRKTPEVIQILTQFFGEGLLFVEGTQHRQQRRIMNPAFSVTQIRALTETFFAKANRLRDLWSSESSNDPTATIAGTRIDVVPWVNKVTFDIIGLTGFNYDFDALEETGEPNKLSEAFQTLFAASQKVTALNLLQMMIPALRLIASPTANGRKVEAAKRTMMQIGEELLANAKADVLSNATENGKVEKNSLRGQDLLSLLVRANMATDIPESQRLSDKDVVMQVPTFVVAGHETTSAALTWALYALTQAPEVQRKLRDELLSVGSDTPSMDELVALPYLDMVLKEVLRVYPPILATARLATKHDVLPVGKPYTDRYGAVHTTIPIAKGDRVFIPIQAMNKSKELWGHDAHEFRPERWADVPEAASQVPGIWGHMMTFIGGPRACIGHRFSIVESKAILFSLVRAFEFELAVPASQIGSGVFIAIPETVRSEVNKDARWSAWPSGYPHGTSNCERRQLVYD